MSSGVLPDPLFWIRVVREPLDRGDFGHEFCGAPRLDAPYCPNCERPFLQYAWLSGEDKRLDLQGFGTAGLSLLFCWRCNVAQQPFHYRVDPTGTVRLVHAGRGGVESGFPYPNYPSAFPMGRLRLDRATLAEFEIVERIRSGELDACDVFDLDPKLADPRHHVSDRPAFETDWKSPNCTKCERPMNFLAGFADNCLDSRGFTGEASVQVLFHVCRRCCEVGVVQISD